MATTAIAQKGQTTYSVAGKEITLSYQTVRDYLVRGSKEKVSDQEVAFFIALCQGNEVNPFMGEAYLIKYGDTPAQSVVAYDALRKRAESNPDYEGIEYGVIVQRGDDVKELEGAFLLPTDKLLGAWAKVYRKERKPYIAKVALAEYDKKQSTWKEKPATMICKVAKAQAMREAYPSKVGGLYTEEEYAMSSHDTPQDVQAEVMESRLNKQGTHQAPVDTIAAIEQAAGDADPDKGFFNQQ